MLQNQFWTMYMLHSMVCLLCLTPKLVLKHVYVLFHALFSFPYSKTSFEASICHIPYFVFFPSLQQFSGEGKQEKHVKLKEDKPYVVLLFFLHRRPSAHALRLCGPSARFYHAPVHVPPSGLLTSSLHVLVRGLLLTITRRTRRKEGRAREGEREEGMGMGKRGRRARLKRLDVVVPLPVLRCPQSVAPPYILLIAASA